MTDNSKALSPSSIKQGLFELQADKRYGKLEFLNAGSMKKVFQCEDRATGRLVAYATPSSNEDLFIESFLREAKITASLQHPNIIPIYDMGFDGETPFFTMKLINGHSLADFIFSTQLKISLNELLNIFIKICDAVSYAHSHGIVHLDLKPENIHLSDHGEVLLTDWGLAKIIQWDSPEREKFWDTEAFQNAEEMQSTLFGYVKGTPGYLSPEQAKGSSTTHSYESDIYSLGAILYTILFKETPIQGLTLKEVLDRTMKGQISKPKTDVPSSLSAICLKALKLSPDERYHSVKDLLEDLRLFEEGFAPKAEKPSILKQVQLRVKRHTAVFISLIFFSFLLTLISASTNLQLNNKNKILAKQKAEISQTSQELQSQKEAAEQLLIDYKNAQDKLKVYTKISASQYYKEAIESYNSDKYSEAFEACMESLKINPHNPQTNTLFAKLALAKMDLKSLSKIIEEHSSKELLKYKSLLETYYRTPNIEVDEKVKTNAFFNLYRAVYEHKLIKTSDYMLKHYITQANSTNLELSIVMRLLMYFNEIDHISSAWWKGHDKYYFEIKNVKKLRNLKALNAIPIKKLVLRNCQDINLKDINLPELEALAVIYSELDEWSLLNINKLPLPKMDIVSLDHSNVKSIDCLAYLDLRHLSIRGLDLKDYSALNTIDDLEIIFFEKVPENLPDKYKELVKIVSPDK